VLIISDALRAQAIAQGSPVRSRKAIRPECLELLVTPSKWTGDENKIGALDMPLTTVLITIVAAGVVLWLVNRFIPMQGQIKSILNAVVVIVLVVWLGNLYGLFDHLRQFRVGR
jgi:hypothetical protein